MATLVIKTIGSKAHIITHTFDHKVNMYNKPMAIINYDNYSDKLVGK
jgi:hypothetical protein